MCLLMISTIFVESTHNKCLKIQLIDQLKGFSFHDYRDEVKHWEHFRRFAPLVNRSQLFLVPPGARTNFHGAQLEKRLE